MSKQKKLQKIQELTQKLSELKEQWDRFDAEAREWAEKRNRINEQFKDVRTEATELKNERNKLNERVRELKQLREKTRAEIRDKLGGTRESKRKIKALTDRKPSKSLETLQKELETIEWKIQTTSLSLPEEKELVEKVKRLEIQLRVHKRLRQLKQGMLELQAEVKTLETKNKCCHEKLTEIAQKSQEIHEKMLNKIDEARELKVEADSLHQSFLQARERAKAADGDIIAILDEMKPLREAVRMEEEKEKRKNEEALRKKLEEQAREKLKRGGKLTWEEFQILAEKGIRTQD